MIPTSEEVYCMVFGAAYMECLKSVGDIHYLTEGHERNAMRNADQVARRAAYRAAELAREGFQIGTEKEEP